MLLTELMGREEWFIKLLPVTAKLDNFQLIFFGNSPHSWLRITWHLFLQNRSYQHIPLLLIIYFMQYLTFV